MTGPPDRSSSRARSRRRGAAAIEFSLCLVFVFVPLMAAILEWSWYFYQEVAIMRIARDAARVGVADTVASGARASAAQEWAEQRLIAAGYDVGGSEVSVTYPADSITAGAFNRDLLRVEIAIPYSAIIGLLPTDEQVDESQRTRRKHGRISEQQHPGTLPAGLGRR